jgi:hypothetical protein
MAAAWWAPLSLGLAVLVQVGAIAFWGGRISSRLEGLAQRLERLEQIELRRAA